MEFKLKSEKLVCIRYGYDFVDSSNNYKCRNPFFFWFCSFKEITNDADANSSELNGFFCIETH